MLASRVISVTIRRPYAAVYGFAHKPENFPRWAAGLSTSLKRDGTRWIAATPEGPAEVVFSPPNDFGILDHWVILPGRAKIYLPIRVVANGDATDVQFTLFRQPEMSEADWDRDAGMVTKDLASLKALLEA